MRAHTQTQLWLQSVALWTVVASVAVAPWLIGAAEPWAYLLLSLPVAIGTAAWLFSTLTARRPHFAAPALSLMLVAIAGYVVFQMCPIRAGLLVWLQSFSATLRDRTIGIFNDVNIGVLLPSYVSFREPANSTSVSAHSTYRSFALLVMYLGVFFVSANAPRRWEHVRNCAIVLLGSGFLLALFGVIQKYSGTYEIYWFYTPRHGGDFFGPFTNRNHFAASMNMTIGLAFGLFFATARSRAQGSPATLDPVSRMTSRRAAAAVLSAFAAAVIGGASCFALSRGGMISLAAVSFVFGAVLAARKDTPFSMRSGAAAVALLMTAAVVWLGRDAVAERLASLADVADNPLGNQRAVVTADSLRILGAFPLFGCGFGCFRHIFPMFQSPALEYRWLHAHNDWAQLLAEGGVVGALLFALAIVLWVRHLTRRAPGASTRARSFAIGCCLGIATIALHSFVDYSLHKPANAMLLSAMCGLAISAVELRKPAPRTLADTLDGAPADHHEAPSGMHTALRTVAVIAIAFIVGGAILQARELRGELAFARFLRFSRMAQSSADASSLKRYSAAAAREAEITRSCAAHNPDALDEITDSFLKWGFDQRLDRSFRTAIVEKAVENTAVAAYAAPTDYLNWLWLARTLMSLGLWQEAEAALEGARTLVRNREEIRMFQPQAEPRSDL